MTGASVDKYHKINAISVPIITNIHPIVNKTVNSGLVIFCRLYLMYNEVIKIKTTGNITGGPVTPVTAGIVTTPQLHYRNCKCQILHLIFGIL